MKMTVRIPKAEHDALLNEAKETLQAQSSVLQWHTLHCELITPMYGGGVISTKVDEKMPIRASAIRGQLRFWWRLLAKHQWNLEDIAKAEQKLWGGIGDADGQAGQVLLRVKNCSKPNVEEWAIYEQKPNQRLELKPREWANVPYVLFPAQGKLKNGATAVEENPHKLLREGFKWELQVAFGPNLAQDQQNQVIETLQWWANFGGLGFRSRKGLGAVYVSQSLDYPQITQRLTNEKIRQAKCQLVTCQDNPTDALRALSIAVKKLADFRQKPNVGRNEGQQTNRPGRSRWSEPDALRRIYNRHAPNHVPVHPAGNIFARAVFGLPILFDFGPSGRQGDPSVKTMLEPSDGKRLASPLILRPIFAGEQNGQKQWRSAALVLPYKHILGMKVQVKGGKYPIWTQDAAGQIRPIAENGGIDPLQAFLTYFAK